jgi:hypothetical protein
MIPPSKQPAQVRALQRRLQVERFRRPPARETVSADHHDRLVRLQAWAPYPGRRGMGDLDHAPALRATVNAHAQQLDHLPHPGQLSLLVGQDGQDPPPGVVVRHDRR